MEISDTDASIDGRPAVHEQTELVMTNVRLLQAFLQAVRPLTNVTGG